MWARRLAAVTVTVTVALVATTVPVRAGGPDEPIVADVNGDGVADRNTLSHLSGPNQCGILVELGLPGGGYAPAESYPYLSALYCPDMGVGLDLDGDAAEELAITWFSGPPPSVDHTLLVLDGFAVSAGFDTIFQPSYIGTADFNGDGRQDVYEWTDQGDGFTTYLNTGTGALTPGPVRYCSGRPEFQLADFDADTAMDVVIGYFEGCGSYFTGVVVVLDDGTVVDLQGDVNGDDQWTVEALDVNGDGHLDVRTTSTMTGVQHVFLGTGTGAFHRSPTAILDNFRVSGLRATNLAVRANDYATGRARLSIVTSPAHGSVQITSAGTIIYRPNPNARAAADRFVYRLTEQGRASNAAVSLRLAR
ncbi:FG-GAP-like repeat-containing protein [Plantactinospora sonchi]|uniref:FG-GAP-like repeat-containing protein n=1 Tax=Plantactinospora sonchi TaxID=1544735 RepID=A0ABU7RMR4_9ACTN